MGTLQHIIVLFQEAFEQLQADVAPRVLERLAILVHKSMAADSRRYHRPDHVFALAKDAAPLRTLAALFHDIIYYQIDEDFLPEIAQILSPYIREQDRHVYLAENISPEARCVHLTREVFGFEPGQQLPPFGGMNEFLSALLMNAILQPLLPEATLVQLAVYVEATIPFRAPNANGEAFTDVVERRIARIAERDHLPIDAETRVALMKSAVVFANADVQGFAERDPGIFLDNTWKLLPESHRSLRSAELYSIRDYRRAIQGTETFLGGLDPQLVFHQYGGVPSDEEFEELVEQARTNLRIAIEYLGIKLVSMAILEALADVTGGDVPLSLFTGNPDCSPGPLAPPSGVEPSAAFDQTSPVFTLLDQGRISDIDFDIRRSPLSAFLYTYQAPAALQQMLMHAKMMFAGHLSCQEFLSRIDPAILASIADNCARAAITRRDQLRPYGLGTQVF